MLDIAFLLILYIIYVRKYKKCRKTRKKGVDMANGMRYNGES
jgi:hypothetical protein